MVQHGPMMDLAFDKEFASLLEEVGLLDICRRDYR
jgi:hypothetical protein